MRRYVAIRPSASEHSGPLPKNDDERLIAKRRRVGVSVACNACRRKKIRCDGQRPSCANCAGGSDTCTYRDDTTISQESQLLLLEVIRLLNAVPDDEAVRRLQSLKKEIDTEVILTTLRQNGDPKQHSFELSIPHAPNGDPFQVLELSAQNPIAYPQLPDLDLETLQEATYQQLVQPTNHKQLGHPSQLNTEEQTMAKHSPYPREETRLSNLDITQWTNVPIASEDAARAISIYLETDHPLLGFFEPDLFIADLVNGRQEHCSPLLVNSLLYWACQMNSVGEHDNGSLALSFCAEAEELWNSQEDVDSILSLAAVQFLSLGYLGQGRDHLVLSYIRDASRMAVRMGLFGVEENNQTLQELATLSTAMREAYTYAAWGSFNWATHMSLFYRQPGLPCPASPPRLPIPQHHAAQSGDKRKRSDYTGGIFPDLCRFWSIVHEVALLYSRDGGPPPADQKALRFAEYKFRELLAWSNGLSQNFTRDGQGPHYIQVLHIWFHAAILDLFRHTVSSPLRNHRLRTFTSPESSPEKVYEASVNQLKQLIVNYRLNFTSSSYSVLWHIALTYLANALLHEPKEQDWFFYFLVCVYGYERLRPRWRVTRAISTALLSMALRKGDISSITARKVLSNLDMGAGPDTFSQGDDVRATFMADLDLAWMDPGSATVERLAGDFEQNLMLQEYTNVLDGSDVPEN